MDRQLSPTPAVLAYILKHMDRSFDAASDIVAELDRQSMSTKRPITRAMAATVMAKGAPLTICAQEV
jgi:chromosomal replication initiation ATPase DnaA